MSADPVAPGAVVEVVVDVPRGGFVKRGDDGRVDFVSPLPCPFNYGSVPGTRSGDGDRLDALVLGSRLPRGRVVRCRAVGCVRFVDAGLDDPKLVCSGRAPTERQWRAVARFFRAYAVAKRALHGLRGGGGPTRYDGLERWPEPGDGSTG